MTTVHISSSFCPKKKKIVLTKTTLFELSGLCSKLCVLDLHMQTWPLCDQLTLQPEGAETGFS